jgi:hypothetical protein
MKRLQSLIAAVMLLTITTGPILYTTGCAGPNVTAYKAVDVTRVTVQEALTLWNQYVKDNHPGAAAELKVKAAFEKWKAGALVVVDAGAVWSAAINNSSPTDVVNSALNAFELAVTNAAQYQMDFVNLVQTLTGKAIVR